MRSPPWLSLVVATSAMLLVSCNDATQVDVVLRSNVQYAPGTEVGLWASRSGAIGAPLVQSSAPWQLDGEIGNVVVTPEAGSGDGRNAPLAVRVAMGLRGKRAADCSDDGDGKGCIIARRKLSFLPHKRLRVPIVLYLACEGVKCGPDTTCSYLGKCAPADIDPNTCTTAEGCTLPGEPPFVPGVANAIDASVDGPPEAQILSGLPTTPYSSATSLTLAIGGPNTVAYTAALRSGALAASCDGATYPLAFQPISVPLVLSDLGPAGEKKRLCVLGRNQAGVVQGTPTQATWTTAAPMTVPDGAGGIKRSVNAPFLTAPSTGCAWLTSGFGTDVGWHPTTAGQGATINIFSPCKFGDAGADGWHLSRGVIDLDTLTSRWIDADPGTAGVQPIINKFATAQPLDVKYANFGLDQNGAVWGFLGGNLWHTHPVRGAALETLATSNVDANVASWDQGLVATTSGTWRETVNMQNARIYVENGVIYYYQYVQDAAGRAYIAATTSSDLVTFAQPTNYILADHYSPDVFRLGVGKYLMVARSRVTGGWDVFQGTSPLDFDPSTKFAVPLSQFSPAPGAWDVYGGVASVVGTHVWNSKLYFVYLAGTSGYTPETAPYNAARDYGLIEFPLSSADTKAFIPELTVSVDGVLVAPGAAVDLSGPNGVATTKQLVLKNTGRDVLTLPASAFAAPAGFSVSPRPKGVSLAPGEQDSIEVGCPAATTSATGTLDLQNSSPFNARYLVQLICARPHTANGVPTNGLTVWLRASDISAGLASGDRVQGWPDLSGLGHSVAQPAVNGQPTWHNDPVSLVNGQPIVRFSGRSCLAGPTSGAGASSATVFVVAKGASYASLYRTQDASGYLVYPWATNNTFILDKDGDTASGLPSGLVAGQWNIGVARYQPNIATNGMLTRRNGAVVGQRSSVAGSITPVGLSVGCLGPTNGDFAAREYANADLAELLVFDRALADPEVLAVEGYLNGRYGVF